MTATRSSHVRWFLIFWLFVLSAVSFLDRVNISIASNSIVEQYGFNNIQLGYIFSALLAGYAIFQTIGGMLADRFGSRRVLAAGVLWWGIFTALTAAVPSQVGHALLLFISVRFLLGAGEAVVYPASNHFVARWFPVQERGIANGLIFAGVGVGAGFTPPLISYLIFYYGWRGSFWVCSILGCLAGAVWFVAARDTPQEHGRVSKAELEQIHTGLTVPSSFNRKSESPLIPWSRVLRSKDVWAVTISYFCFGYVAWIFFSWFYRYLATVRGLNLKASAFYAMLPFLAMAVTCPLGGLISDRLTKWRGPRLGRCGVAVLGIGLAAAFIAFGAQVSNARVASVVLAGGAGALYLSQSSFWSVTAGIAGPSSGFVSGFMNTGGQLGGFVTATLTPFVAARFGWTASFLLAAALCVVGAVAWLLVDPEASLVEP
ncbi:MAG: MFS transporter [Acidobacteria bacterium]|jgi:ACS family glucarate transporter-like MFS transporter|nr:MAG: MFS transporter [Acidobacteriota bacterium]